MSRKSRRRDATTGPSRAAGMDALDEPRATSGHEPAHAAVRARSAPPAAGAGGLRSAWPAFATIALVWATLFAPQLGGGVFKLGDAREYRPYAEFSRARWFETRERTFWNPYVFCGIAASASLADSRPQYLPDWGIDIYERTRTLGACPLGGPLLAHLLGMLAVAVLARALWGAGLVGMAGAGVAWGLMTNLLVPFVFGHGAQFVSSSLMPVVMLAVHAVFAAEGLALGAAVLGLGFAQGFQILTGHPQIVVYSGMLAAAFAIERALHFGRWRRVLLFGGGVVLGVAIAAAVWWPTLLYSAQSFRGGGGEHGMSLVEAERYSLGWSDYLSLVWPHAVGLGGASYWGGMQNTDYPRFVGTLVVLFATVGLMTGDRSRRGTAVFIAGAIVASLTVSLGAHLGPLYAWLHGNVPFWSKFRVPSAAMIVSQLGFALLAARGLDAVVRGEGASAGRLTRLGWLALGVAALAGVLMATGPLSRGYAALALASRPGMAEPVALAAAHRAGIDLALRAGLLAIAISLVLVRAPSWRRLVPPAPIALLLVDLGSVAVPFLRRGTGTLRDIESPSPPVLAVWGAAHPGTRVMSVRHVVTDPRIPIESERNYEFYFNDWITWRARTPGGNHGAVPSMWRPFAASPLMRSSRVITALGVVSLSLDPGTTLDSTLYERIAGGAEPIYRLRHSLGRVYAVGSVQAPGSNDIAVVREMREPRWNPATTALTTDAHVAGTYPGSARARFRWVDDQPDQIVLDVEAPEAAFVVVADSWFPGWRADLDGSPTMVHRVNQLLRGIQVPGGRHRLTMRYEPEGWGPSVTITRAALALWLVLAIGLAITSLARRRRAGG